jgi:hypothetical protein
VSRYECVADQKAAGFPVNKACEVAEVSTSGFYDWCTRTAAGPTERELADEGSRPLSPMSSDALGEWLLRVRCVGEHRPEDDVGESSFERPDGFLAGSSRLGSTSEVGDGVWMGTCLGERDPVDRSVELSVAGAAEAVSVVVA